MVKCLHLSIMSMPQVHLSIRQIRHAGSKLVWGGVGSGEGLPLPLILPTIISSGLVLAVCPLFSGSMRDDGARRAELATHERDTASRIAPLL